jgi:hypothetical protein
MSSLGGTGTTTALATAVAAYGLAGSLTELPSQRLDDRAWRDLLAEVRRQRLTGHLVQALVDGAFPADDVQVNEAAAVHARAMADALVLEDKLIAAVDQLAQRGVATRVLKGPAAAHLDYPDPALRSFGDIDLLVRSADFDAAVAALAANGYRRRFPEPRPGFDRRFGKGATLWNSAGREVDLHRTLAFGPFGLRIRLDDLWAPGVAFTVGGRELTALPAELRLLHACYHTALGDHPPRLVPQRDIAQLLLAGRGEDLNSGLNRGLDVDAVRRLAAAWRGEAVVAQAIRTTWDSLQIADVVALSAWAARYQPDARELRDLLLYTSERASYAGKSLGALRAVPGLRAKLQYLRALAFPRRGYVHHHHISSIARLKHGAEALSNSDGQGRRAS